MMLKSISKPFSLSTILGCAEEMWRFLAVPLPWFLTSIPRVKGTEGSICIVKGSSAKTSR